MVGVKEEQVCIKFCFKLGRNAAKTHKILQQAFGDDFWVICNPMIGLMNISWQ